MSLLHDIQAAAIDPNCSLGSLLLKLRLLASRLGSTPLEEWIKHEAEGYPKDSPIPEYRVLSPRYSGNFAGAFGGGIQDAPIPPQLVERVAGKAWVTHEIRESVAAIDELLNYGDDGELIIDASPLILLFKGIIYPDFSPISVTGHINRAEVKALHYAVRSRILEFTIALERAVPAAVDVAVPNPVSAAKRSSDTTTKIFNQTIYGDYSGVTSTGVAAQITSSIARGDATAVVGELVKAGIPDDAARAFADAIAAEQPEGPDRPFGKRAAAWLKENIGKALDGTWKVGAAVATKVLEEAAMKYYGLK